MQTIKGLIAMAVVAWAMWWIISTPSRSLGRARAMVVTIVALLVGCIAGGL